MAGRGTAEADLPGEIREALLRGRWYFQRGEEPGFFAVEGPEGPLVAVFSSVAELARYAGACEWFSTLGADLMTLLPEDHGLVVDLAGSAPQLLPAELVDPLRPDPADSAEPSKGSDPR
ncbi:SseB family protein [Streptomyces sp. NBC_01016]|uniref:SseB family protein n=1 Tax=Streptomyces sp. NBC_01016 TaxID=2903720 RepID=UPI002252A716|nr:SseB family protein [Streptomyces sp. NBC_01016]MCX4834434.1 SseB family protein [Streptomyces sp. NBC_01016]